MQLTYNIDPVQAREGSVADASLAKEIVSRLADAGGIEPGRMVCFDHDRATQDVNVGSLPGAAVDITLNPVGVSIYDASCEFTTPLYAEDYAFPVLRKGRIWVIAEDTITLDATGGLVYARHVAGSGNLGGFRGANVVGETAVVPGARWLSSTSGAGELALMEINLPQ